MSALFRLRFVFRQLGGQIHGRLWARENASGARVKTTYAYDLAGRPTSVTYNDGTPAVSMTYYADGQKRTLTDAARVHTYAYEGPGGRAYSRRVPRRGHQCFAIVLIAVISRCTIS